MSQHRDPDPLARYLAGSPCPAWCDHADDPRGHPFIFDPILDDPGRPLYQRIHEGESGRVPGVDADPPVTLSVEQDERTHAPDSGTTQRQPVTLWLNAPAAVAELSSRTARQLAAALMDAADELDQLHQSDRPDSDSEPPR